GGMLDRRFKEEKGIAGLPGVIDLAIFYGRNNLLLNGDVGWVPGNVYATITEGLDRMAEACGDVWRSGAVGGRLVYQRFERCAAAPDAAQRCRRRRRRPGTACPNRRRRRRALRFRPRPRAVAMGARRRLAVPDPTALRPGAGDGGDGGGAVGLRDRTQGDT